MRKRFLLTLPLTLVVLAAAGCGGGDETPRPTATIAPTLAEPTAATAPAPSEAREITVRATFPSFQPSDITVATGEVVLITVTASDTNHTFTVDELRINIAVGKGQTITTEI